MMKRRTLIFSALAGAMTAGLAPVRAAIAAEAGVVTPRLNVLPLAGAQVSHARKFMVYFDYDSSVLSSSARDLLAYVASVSAESAASMITITGHTDAAGSRFYNLGLSPRRAMAVGDALAGRRVPRSSMQIYWRGEFEPLIPTPDGVEEFRNRRAEIIVE